MEVNISHVPVQGSHRSKAAKLVLKWNGLL